MRGNFILYFFEAIMLISAGLTFTSTENQKYLEVLLLIVMVTSFIHGLTSLATVCAWKKWPLIILDGITAIISIVMLIMNAKTDEDAKVKKVAVPWQWKAALFTGLLLTLLTNVALIPAGQNWRCTGSDDLKCANKDNLDALKISVRKYYNAELGDKKPIKGIGSRKVNVNNLGDDTLETEKIAYITVDDEGNEIFDCKGFKAKVDRMTSKVLTAKKQQQVEEKQALRKQQQEEKKKQQDISFDPSKPQYKYMGGGPFGAGAQRQLVAPPIGGLEQYRQAQAAKQAEDARVRALAKKQDSEQKSLKERLAAGKLSMAKRVNAKEKTD